MAPAAPRRPFRAWDGRARQSVRDSVPTRSRALVAGPLWAVGIDGLGAAPLGQERLAVLLSRRLRLRGHLVAGQSWVVGLRTASHLGGYSYRRHARHAGHGVRDGGPNRTSP